MNKCYVQQCSRETTQYCRACSRSVCFEHRKPWPEHIGVQAYTCKRCLGPG